MKITKFYSRKFFSNVQIINVKFFQQAQREDNSSKESASKDASGTDPKGAAKNSEPSISDDEEEMETDETKPKCSNCGILCHVTHSTSKGNFCGTCHQYWNRTGQLRPTTGPARKDGGKAGGTQKYNSLMKNSGKPPKGMYVNHDDLVALATGPTTQGEQLLKAMDREIVSYKRTVSWVFLFSASVANFFQPLKSFVKTIQAN